MSVHPRYPDGGELFTKVTMHTSKGFVRNDVVLETWGWEAVEKGDRVRVPGYGKVEVTHVHVCRHGGNAIRQEVTFNNPNK